MKEFKIDNRVICKEESCGNYNIVGKVGTIVTIMSDTYGIKFDDFIDGHSLDGRCKDGHGWWLNNYHLELYHDKRVKL